MTLDARRIALQGIGYSALFVALQGFAPANLTQPPDVQVGPPGMPFRLRIPRSLRNDNDDLLIIISAALQVLDIN